VTFFILIGNGHSKAEYLSPTFPMIFAAAGVWLQQLLEKRSRLLHALPIFIVVATGLALIPLAAPVLPVQSFVSYTKMLGVNQPNSESRELGVLPQFFSDMNGWEDLAKTVSQVYLSLSEEERGDAVVLAGNYGQAGAIEYFADRYPAPRVISMHNNYWIWGYPARIGTLIVIGGEEEAHSGDCRELIEAAVFHSPYVMPYENNLKIWICRGLASSVEELWKAEKHYI
jgi:hypothetical protein